jgi:hypothetical protein
VLATAVVVVVVVMVLTQAAGPRDWSHRTIRYAWPV